MAISGTITHGPDDRLALEKAMSKVAQRPER